MQRQIAEADAEAEADSIAKLHLGVLHAVKIQKFSPAAGSPATERSARYACGKKPKIFRLRRALHRPSDRHATRASRGPQPNIAGATAQLLRH